MTCAGCGATLEVGALFCENCGTKVGGALGGAVAPTTLDVPVTATDEDSPISVPTAINAKAVVVSAPQTKTCTECGGTVGAEGYCDQCGTKAATERDHFREHPAPWLAGVCDRGIVHSRNEDAMALWADPASTATTGRGVLVVCDGVSSSKDSHVASLAGARAARDVLRAPMPKGLGVPESIEGAAIKVFVSAAAAANTAVMANTAPSSESPASCTFVAATVDPVAGPVGASAAADPDVGPVAGAAPDSRWQIRYAVIGDSRAYWLPDGAEGVQLTTDDSMAQMLIAGGTPKAEAEAAPQAHAITKWLGRDSPDIVPVVGALVVDQPGWLLLCSDGLWNYASEPAAIVAQVTSAATTEPEALALALVDFAKASGGHDNITVAFARLSGFPDPAAGGAPDTEAGAGPAGAGG